MIYVLYVVLVLGALCIWSQLRSRKPKVESKAAEPAPNPACISLQDVLAHRPMKSRDVIWEEHGIPDHGPWEGRAVCACGLKRRVANETIHPGVCNCGRHKDWTFRVERDEWDHYLGHWHFTDPFIVDHRAALYNFLGGSWPQEGESIAVRRNDRTVVWSEEAAKT